MFNSVSGQSGTHWLTNQLKTDSSSEADPDECLPLWDSRLFSEDSNLTRVRLIFAFLHGFCNIELERNGEKRIYQV